MIRVIVYIAKATIATLTAFLLVSCGMETTFKTVKGNGDVVTRERTIDNDFTGIETGGVFEVILEQGSPQSVTIEADSNLQEHIITKVDGTVLKISTNVNTNGGKRKVIVKMPVLREVSASGSSSIKSKDNFKSGNFTIDTSGASEVVVSVTADKVNVNTSGSSRTTISGKAEIVTCDSSGSSMINAKDLAVQKATASASGSSVIKVYPEKSLTADGSGASRITFRGRPAEIVKSNSGSSDVIQE